MPKQYVATCNKCGDEFVCPNPASLYGGSASLKRHHKKGHKKYTISTKEAEDSGAAK